MMSYYTRVKMKDDFNQEELFHLFFDWLENTKNKMEGLTFKGQLPFSYEVNRKKLHLDYFKNKLIIGIQFITTDNRKDAQFVVEVIYHTKDNYCDLIFNKEMTEQSKYIPGTNIPGVFRTLIGLSDEPQFMSYPQFKEHQTKMPVVLLGRNKRCCVSPFELSKDVLGLAEVIVLPTRKEPYMKLMDGDFSQTITTYHSRQITELLISRAINQYQPITFDGYISDRLHDEQQNNEQLQEEMVLETEEKINVAQSNYDDFKEYYTELIEEYDALIAMKLDLEKQIERQKNDYYLMGSKEFYKQEEAVIFDVFRKELQRLDNDDVYRRKDIIKAIMEVMEDED